MAKNRKKQAKKNYKKLTVWKVCIAIVSILLVAAIALAGCAYKFNWIPFSFTTDNVDQEQTDTDETQGETQDETQGETQDGTQGETQDGTQDETQDETQDDNEQSADAHDIEHSSAYGWSSLLATGGELAGGSTEAETAYYYLPGGVELKTDITVTGYVMLCLNGNTLDGTGSGSVITVDSGATFVLCDCSEGESGIVTGGYVESASIGGGGVCVNANGVFYLYSGNISGNAAQYFGGGVYVSAGSVFYMYGGAISKNTVTSNENKIELYGGGVYVLGEFYMFDGFITANYIAVPYGTTSNSSSDGCGGGVAVSSGTFYMSGGSITSNEIEIETGSNYARLGYGLGGGVYVTYGVCYMSDGSISDNVITTGKYTHSRGGGLNLDLYCTFDMSGGTITGNDGGYGGGVYSNLSTVTISGDGRIYSNTATSGSLYYSVTEADALYIKGGYVGGSMKQLTKTSTILISGGIMDETAYASILGSDGNPQYIEDGKSIYYMSDGCYLIY